MTSNQKIWMDRTGYSEYDYVAHLEDACMQACKMIEQKNQNNKKKAIEWFVRFLDLSETHKKTGESPYFLEAGDENV